MIEKPPALVLSIYTDSDNAIGSRSESKDLRFRGLPDQGRYEFGRKQKEEGLDERLFETLPFIAAGIPRFWSGSMQKSHEPTERF